MRKLFFLFTLAALAACIAPPGRGPVEIIDLEEPGSDGVLALPDRRLESGGSSAVDQLLDQASAAMALPDYNRAAALVERALRINPQDARAYFALAQVNYHQHQQAQAETFLQKARALAVNDRQLLLSIDAFGRRIAAPGY